MAVRIPFAFVGLLAFCACAVSAEFLDEDALHELAEEEGYKNIALLRFRRQAPDAEGCTCPPASEGQVPPRPPRRPRPPMGQGIPPGCPQLPPMPQVWWSSRARNYNYNPTPCDLRPLFRIPETFNFTARLECYERWERNTGTEMGFTPEVLRDPSVYKPSSKRPLMWNKGCDMQCHFSELQLLRENGEEVTIDRDAVAALIRGQNDTQEITTAIDETLQACLTSANELIHARQVCRSGADEFLYCLQHRLNEACPGAKWQNRGICGEVEDVAERLRNCRRARRFMRFPPLPPPPRGGRPPSRPAIPTGPSSSPPNDMPMMMPEDVAQRS